MFSILPNRKSIAATLEEKRVALEQLLSDPKLTQYQASVSDDITVVDPAQALNYMRIRLAKMNSEFPIPKNVINLLPASILGTSIYKFDVSEYNKTLSHIKYTVISKSQISDENTIIISLKYKNGQKTKFAIGDFYVSDAPFLTTLIPSIRNLLPSSKIETYARKKVAQTLDSKPSSEFWTDKPTSSQLIMNYYTRNVNEYINIVHPVIINKLKEIFLSSSNKTSFRILDAGGGNGLLAKKIMDLMNLQGIIYQYDLVEPDAVSSQKAREHLKNYTDIKVHTYTIKDFEVTLTNESYDLIISSGGPLNYRVAIVSEARQHLDIFSRRLKKEGTLIATGLTKSLMNSKDFNKAGLDINQTIHRRPNDDDLSFYVLTPKKPTEAPVTQITNTSTTPT